MDETNDTFKNGQIKFFTIDSRKLAYREYLPDVMNEVMNLEDKNYEDDYEDHDLAREQTKIVICAHALTRNSTDFHEFALKISSLGWRVISPDVAGRGESDNLEDEKDYSYMQYLSDILALLDYLKIKTCHWVGTSMGGILGLFVHRQRSNLIKKMVLNDIAPQISAKASKKIFDYFDKNYREFDTYDQAVKVLKETFAFFGIKHEEDWQFFIENSLRSITVDGVDKFTFNYDKRVLNSLNESPDGDITLRTDGGMWELGKNLNMPIMLIWGQLSTMLTYGVIQKFKTYKPDLLLVKVPGVGHAPHFMNDSLVELTINWLNWPENNGLDENGKSSQGFSGEVILYY